MQVRLLLPHEHAGRQYAAGETLDLAADAAAWLVAAGVAEQAIEPVTQVVPDLVPLKPVSAPRRASTKGH